VVIQNVEVPQIMKIYTKTGDDGSTSLFGGRRVSKTDPQVEAYGSADELSSLLGMIVAEVNSSFTKKLLSTCQKDLYRIMAALSGAKINPNFLKKEINLFEQVIDNLSLGLSELKGFILPQGNRAAALTHFARAVCRRCERETIRYYQSHQQPARRQKKLIVCYLNRLSDLLFILARSLSKNKEVVV